MLIVTFAFMLGIILFYRPLKTLSIGILFSLFSIVASASNNTQICLPSALGAHPTLTVDPVLPHITGNTDADTRIRFLAYENGYKQQPILKSTTDIAFPGSVHKCVVAQWKLLKQQALLNNIIINIVSGYRSVERQRQIFLYKIKQQKIAFDEIAAGTADNKIRSILEYSSIPGFSRHHSGFVIDIQANNDGLSAFGYSKAYQWLANNHFKIARQFGFVPSYPNQRPGQGPNPEPWEFMWIGKALAENIEHPEILELIEDIPEQRLIFAALQNIKALEKSKPHSNQRITLTKLNHSSE